ncbi:hypothetical protein [Paraburkholderia sediminicola]|uniref:hypothetical protein n=1 Tax=Paraburkholderia sediminicola TaxID=458836 RepID=UPI0038B96808
MDRKSSRLKRFIEWGRANANPAAREYVSRALQGDSTSIKNLFDRLSRKERARFTLEMYRKNAPYFPFAYFLRYTWIYSWYWLIAAAGNYPTVIEMFRFAKFPIPENLGPTVKAYRGTNGISAYESAATGMSWSLNRDIACHHACDDPLGLSDGAPLVIEAEIPREHILMHTSWGAFFNEITVVPIAANPSIDFRVSRPIDDWAEGNSRYLAVMDTAKTLIEKRGNTLSPAEHDERRATIDSLLGDS